jgi:hypothetical protein
MDDEKPLDPKSIRLDLTVPCDARFRPVRTIISERMAEYLEFPESEARALAASLLDEANEILERDEAPPYNCVEVTFATSDTEIAIQLHCLCEDDPSVNVVRTLTRAMPDDA